MNSIEHLQKIELNNSLARSIEIEEQNFCAFEL